jgi:hypothetical protein
VGVRAAQQQPQQTGMPFIIMQQVQPAFIMAEQQSQQAWIMAQQALSPLVQVIVQPDSVISHLHMPMTMLQQQAIMPFIIMHMLHMPPAIIVQRFCIIEADMASSKVQVTFIPPSHFSIFMVQRGTIIMFMPVGIVPVEPIVPGFIPAVPIPVIPIRSTIIPVIIGVSPSHRVGKKPWSVPVPTERPDSTNPDPGMATKKRRKSLMGNCLRSRS